MAKSRFQLVGSLLRPADLREYKIAIEHRDDIKYPSTMHSKATKKQKQLISEKLSLKKKRQVSMS